ncbi:thioredoxin domain-containing protein [Acetobacterium bakii]|uniref:Thioredoxin n=1 Tax=Acetobacterium bakii TaxID=52689 RepID=A0A0L6TW44_9FIRM|nr:thioredoxin domain-containing protein [Acetobacterium bakii]KNZ40486.1 thioredoxin [Acetobacterium bakii]
MNIKNEKPNYLIDEKSPYLLQHAYNPVEWYPWSEEAFEKAERENKPVFLSIGYSTCHWCHVMEKESFEDDEVAEALNKDFVSIKVDREERPDIDQIYMTFSQVSTGQGGWPLNVFLTPEKKPFYVGTYLPKKYKYGHPGLMDVLKGITNKWKEDQAAVEDSAQKMTVMLNTLDKREKDKPFDVGVFKDTYNYFDKSFDSQYGGFGKEPKFPTPHNLFYLLRYYSANKEPKALKMVEKTLEQMYKGGIFDHIGFGFSRYATDEAWLVPHFEKMLYDNALLLMAYTETFQATGNGLYKDIAEKIITYVTRDLKSPEGGFYCAEDADSEGVEGKFYVWSMDEVVEILGKDEAEFFSKYYPISEEGNFDGKTILNLIETNIETIQENKEVKDKLEEIAQQLFKEREKRIHPYKDDKILTAWNGLMIAALAMAGKAFNNSDCIDQANQAIAFVEKNLVGDDGRLYARYRQGDVKHLGYLDDYAFIIWGYIESYEATFTTDYLVKALKLVEDMITLFGDEDGTPGFYLYGKDAEELIAKPKEIYDSALPSGNSVAAYTLLKLGKLTGRKDLEKKAEDMFAHFAGNLNQAPMAYTMMLSAKLFAEQPTKEIVLAGKKDDPAIQTMLDRLNKKYLPFSVVLLNKGEGDLDQVNDFAKNQVTIDNKPTAYVCANYQCAQPVTDADVFNQLI